MNISYRSAGAITVIDLTGRLAVGPDESELDPLRGTIRDVINAGCRDVAMNLSGLTQLDARGLGELATMMKAMRTAGGRLRLIAASPRVARMLAITRLDTVFEWCDEAETVLTV